MTNLGSARCSSPCRSEQGATPEKTTTLFRDTVLRTSYIRILSTDTHELNGVRIRIPKRSTRGESRAPVRGYCAASVPVNGKERVSQRLVFFIGLAVSGCPSPWASPSPAHGRVAPVGGTGPPAKTNRRGIWPWPAPSAIRPWSRYSATCEPLNPSIRTPCVVVHGTPEARQGPRPDDQAAVSHGPSRRPIEGFGPADYRPCGTKEKRDVCRSEPGPSSCEQQRRGQQARSSMTYSMHSVRWSTAPS